MTAAGTARPPVFDLSEHVARWIAAGVITDEQGLEILRIDGQDVRHDDGADGRQTTGPRRMSPIAELVAYLGIVVVMVSGGITLNRLWKDLALGGRVTVGLVIGGLGLVGGYVLSRLDDDATSRLGRFLWFAGVGGVAMAAAVFTDWSGAHSHAWTLLVVGFVAGAMNGLLWRNLERPLQFLGTVVGLMCVIAGLSQLARWHPSVLTIGLLYWLCAAATAALALSVLRPATTALVVAQCGLFVAALAVTSSSRAPGILLGLLGAGGGVGIGLSTKRSVVTVFAMVSFFVFVVRVISYYLKGPGTTLAATILGVILVGAIIWRSARARDADSMVDHVSQPDERPSSPLR